MKDVEVNVAVVALGQMLVYEIRRRALRNSQRHRHCWSMIQGSARSWSEQELETEGGSPLEVMGHGTGLAWGVIEACWKPGDRWEESMGWMTLSLYEITGAMGRSAKIGERRRRTKKGGRRQRGVEGGGEAFLEGEPEHRESGGRL